MSGAKRLKARLRRLSRRHRRIASIIRLTLIFMATFGGIPVSSTHTITGAIVSVGSERRLSAVRGNVASRIVVAWVVTLPAAGLIGAAFYELATLLSR